MKPLPTHRLLFCGLLAVSTIVLSCRAPERKIVGVTLPDTAQVKTDLIAGAELSDLELFHVLALARLCGIQATAAGNAQPAARAAKNKFREAKVII